MSTTTITASNLRSNLADTLDAVTHDTIVIVKRRGRGKKERAIIDLDRLEDLLAASDPAYLTAIRQARASKEYFSHDDVFGNI